MPELQNDIAREEGCLCFNYSGLLSASCKKKWRFIDAIYGVLPIFGVVTRKAACNRLQTAEHFKELSLQIISTQVGDEINIARLLILAQQQNISQFDIQLPYALSAKQLSHIRDEYRKPVTLLQQDDYLQVRFP